MFKITEITKEEAFKIIKTYAPKGLFWLEDDGKFIAIVNSTEYGLVEEFNNKEECLQWLKDWFKKPDSVELYGNRKVYFNLNSEALESSKELLKYLESRLEYAKQEKQRIQIQYNVYDTMLNGTIKEINRISTLINNLKENIKLSEESWKAHKGE